MVDVYGKYRYIGVYIYIYHTCTPWELLNDISCKVVKNHQHFQPFGFNFDPHLTFFLARNSNVRVKPFICTMPMRLDEGAGSGGVSRVMEVRECHLVF